MWERIKAWFRNLIGMPAPVAVPKPPVVEPGEPMIPVRVAEEMVRDAQEQPVTVPEAIDLGEVEYDEKGRCLCWIDGHKYRFANRADAEYFATVKDEASLSEDGLWCGLKLRPADDDEGWMVYDRWFFNPYFHPWVRHTVWIDPETKRIEWRDSPNQYGNGTFAGSTGPGYYHIMNGVQDLAANPWNMKWQPKVIRDDKRGMERIKAYSGTPPADLLIWPMEYKAAYRETH